MIRGIYFHSGSEETNSAPKLFLLQNMIIVARIGVIVILLLPMCDPQGGGGGDWLPPSLNTRRAGRA